MKLISVMLQSIKALQNIVLKLTFTYLQLLSAHKIPHCRLATYIHHIVLFKTTKRHWIRLCDRC